MKFLRKIFGIKSHVMELEVKFHKDCNLFGEHGTICVSHKKQRLNEASVKFVFVGVSTAPHLTPALLEYVWNAASDQGYIVHHVVEYGIDNSLIAYDEAHVETARVVPFAMRLNRSKGA